MRRDMLSNLAGGDGNEDDVRFGVPAAKDDKPSEAGNRDRDDDPKQEEGKDVDWEAMVSGTKRVLSMTVSYQPLFKPAVELITVC